MSAERDATAVTPNADLIDLFLKHLARRHPESTVATYRSPLYRADRDLPPPGGLYAYPADIEDWLWTFRSPSTRAVYRSAIGTFFRWAIAVGKADYNPTEDVGRIRIPKRRPRPVTHDQLRTILTGSPEPVRLWALIAAYTGARAVEVARLRLPDDVTPDVVYLDGKGDNERVVPTHPVVWDAVRGLPPGPLVPGRSRKRVSDRANYRFRRLGLTITFHQLRHWYGTYVTAGGNSRITQELMGHANLATTEVYTAVSAEAARAAVLRLPVIGDGDGAGPGRAAA